MKLKTILKITNGKIINNVDAKEKIRKIQIDSRKVKKNDLFIAIVGKNKDGHDYINDAIKAGANAIICEKNINIETNIPIIKVTSTINALGSLALANRIKNKNIPLIAITGSCGKTTTKELISLILSKKYNVLKNEGSLNNHLGLPMTLLDLNDKYDVAVLEMGMNHENEISYLSNIALPNYGIITNIGSSHIGNLGSKKNILKAKMEITDGISNGILIVNGEDKYLKKVKYKNIIKVKNDAYDLSYEFSQTTFKLNIDNKEYSIKFNVPGKHLIMDVLLAIKVGLLFNVEVEDIISSIDEYRAVNGRLNIILKDELTIIDDAYNSSFESLMGSLSLLNKKTHNIVILGDILELGDKSYKIHKKINKKIKKIPIEHLLLIGEYTKVINGIHFDDLDSLLNYLYKILRPDSFILIKGSAKMNLKYIVDDLKKPR